MFTVYGIPNCDTVKKARIFLEKKNIDFSFVDFKKTPPKNSDIERWQKAFGDFPVNKKGVTYKKHKEIFERLSDKEKQEFLIQNSSMVKRPIFEKDGKVLCFGFDEKEYSSILK